MTCPMKTLQSITEQTWAFLLLRLFLGLRFVHAFVGKMANDAGEMSLNHVFESSAGIASGFAGKLPGFALIPFSYGLPWVELITGVAVLLGIYTRCSLVWMGLTYVALCFGHMVSANYPAIADTALHLGFVVGALLLVRHNIWALCSPCSTSEKA